MLSFKDLISYLIPTSSKRSPIARIQKELLTFYPVTSSNKDFLLKSLISLAGLLADKTSLNQSLTQYFLDTNMQAILIRIFKAGFKQIMLQVLKISQILIQQGDKFLFLQIFEQIITHPIDFDNQTAEQYSFLLSQIVKNASSAKISQFLVTRKFCLLNAAMMISIYPNFLVKANCRMVVLSILRLPTPEIKQYFSEANFIQSLISKMRIALTDQIQESVDIIYYLADISQLHIESISNSITRQLSHIINSDIIFLIDKQPTRTLYFLVHLIKNFPESEIAEIINLNMQELCMDILENSDQLSASLVMHLIDGIIKSKTIIDDLKSDKGLITNWQNQSEIIKTLAMVAQRSGFHSDVRKQAIGILQILTQDLKKQSFTRAMWNSLNQLRYQLKEKDLDQIISYFERGWEVVAQMDFEKYIPCRLSFPQQLESSEQLFEIIKGFLMLLRLKLSIEDQSKKCRINFYNGWPCIEVSCLKNYNQASDQEPLLCNYASQYKSMEIKSNLWGFPEKSKQQFMNL